MIRLVGEVESTVDNKCRLKVPSSMLKQYGEMPDEFVIQIGIGDCLYLFRKQEWEEFQTKLDQLDDFDPNQIALYRRLQHGANILNMDSSERILMPKRLMEKVGIEKEVVLFCVRDHIEIWDADKYNTMLAAPMDILEETTKYLKKSNL